MKMMKAAVVVVLSAGIVLGCASTEPVDESATALAAASTTLSPGPATVARTEGDGLYLRSGPGTQYAPIDLLPEGASVTIVRHASDGWYRVEYRGRRGYSYGAFLEAGTGADDGRPSAESGSAVEGAADRGAASGIPSGCATLTRGQAEQLLRTTGFPEWTLPEMLRIIDCESSFQTCAHNPNNMIGTQDFGLLQINQIWIPPGKTGQDLFDPWLNAKIGLEVFNMQGLNAWVCHNL